MEKPKLEKELISRTCETPYRGWKSSSSFATSRVIHRSSSSSIRQMNLAEEQIGSFAVGIGLDLQIE
jgi:hypothetical protein